MQSIPAAGFQIMDVETAFETPPWGFQNETRISRSDIFMWNDEACFRLHFQKASDAVK